MQGLSWVFAASSIRPILPAFLVPLPLVRKFLSRGSSYTQHTFSRKRMDALLHVAMAVYPEHPASKVVSAFLCLGALKHSTARSTSFQKVGWQRLLIG